MGTGTTNVETNTYQTTLPQEQGGLFSPPSQLALVKIVAITETITEGVDAVVDIIRSVITTTPCAVGWRIVNPSGKGGLLAPLSGVANFDPGDLMVRLTLPSEPDVGIVSGTRTVQVFLETPLDCVIDPVDGHCNIQVTDQLATTVSVAVLTPATGQLIEGNTGSQIVQFKITKSGGPAACSVSWTRDGSIGDSDLVTPNQFGTATFGEFDTEVILQWDIRGDIEVEANETLIVTLRSVVNASILQATAQVTVLNQDLLPTVVVAVVGAITVYESNAGDQTLTFRITRNGNPLPCSVAWAREGTIGSDDLVVANSSGSVNFTPTLSSVNLTWQLKGDVSVEPNETLSVALKAGAGCIISSVPATITILNDDVSILVPVIVTAPLVSGENTVGSTLQTTNGTWSNSPTSYLYQWVRRGNDIVGETARTYLTVHADQDDPITCRVTARNVHGSSTPALASNSITMVAAPFPPFSTSPPHVTGSSVVDSILTTNNGTWNNAPTGFVYAWLRDNAVISGQNATTYRTVAADVGHNVCSRVTASNEYGATSSNSNLVSVTSGSSSLYNENLPYQGLFYGCYGAGLEQIHLMRVGSSEHGAPMTMRFVVQRSGTIVAVRLQNRWAEAGDGYSSGNGGTIRYQLRADDGSSNHRPVGSSLANSDTFNPESVGSGNYPRLAFTPSVAVAANTIMHVVGDEIAGSMWASTNGGCAYFIDNSIGMGPWYRNDFTQLNFRGGSWKNSRSDADAGELWAVPVIWLEYSDGVIVGTGPWCLGDNYPDVGGAQRLRWNFVSNRPTINVRGMWFRTMRSTSAVTSDLLFQVKNSSQTVIASASIPYSSVNVGHISGNEGFHDNGAAWGIVRHLYLTWNTPWTMNNGSRYYVEASATGVNSGVYLFRVHERVPAAPDHLDINMIPGALAERSLNGGTSWTEDMGDGNMPKNTSDLPWLFTLVDGPTQRDSICSFASMQ